MQKQGLCHRWIVFFLTFACATSVHASVVLTGTRVIYPAGAEQTLHFSNPDFHPNVVQLWVDGGDRQSTPDTADTPFMVLPEAFRIEPQGGQMVRMLLPDPGTLAQDRESVFYLNFRQMPVQKKSQAHSNQLLLMFTSRVKVFYRPAAIEADLPQDIAERLRLKWLAGALHVYNPTPYHVTVIGAELVTGDTAVRIEVPEMVTPFTDTVWRAAKADVGQDLALRLTIRNDYGADVTTELRIL